MKKTITKLILIRIIRLEVEIVNINNKNVSIKQNKSIKHYNFDNKVVMKPSLEDLETARQNFTKLDKHVLKDWATFILTSDQVDFTSIEGEEGYNEILNLIWDLSFIEVKSI